MSALTLVCGLVLLILPVKAADKESAGAPSQDLTALSLEQLLDIKVEGAALHPQSLEDAPASVSIITAEDIRKYGYRTLGEALASVHGFYTSNNRTFETVGVRGFNLPGDYASRFLVMVNGHNMADNIFDFELYFGRDFPIDMNLIKRIEVIRGPSSALYGSNGIFATINIITKSPDEAGPATLTAEAGSFGQKKGQVMTAASLGPAKLLFSGSVFNDGGESPLYFPEFNSPTTNNGLAVNVDGERGYHFFSNLDWQNWTLTAVFSGRREIQPISWGPTIFNERGTTLNDTRNFVEAAYTRKLGRGTLQWRTYYDAFYERDRFDYPLDSTGGVEDNRQDFLGDWVGTHLTYRFDSTRLGSLTLGGEGKFDLRNLQLDRDVQPAFVPITDISRRDRSFALFAQDERKLSSRWTLDLGIRLDVSSYRPNFMSPRAALIYQPSPVWSYKFLYGRGVRNPSAFELFFDDGGRSGAPNPDARPEKADTFEIDVERKLGKRMNLVTSGYAYRLHDFLVGVYNENNVIRYLNLGKIHAAGFEVEVNGRPAAWLEAAASYAIQQSDDNDADGKLENSPAHLAKFRFAVPLGRKFDVSSGMQFYSSRRTLAGAYTDPVYLADFTVTSKRLLANFDVQFGLRNTFDWKYSDPIALNPVVDTMRQPGRSFFVQLISHAAR